MVAKRADEFWFLDGERLFRPTLSLADLFILDVVTACMTSTDNDKEDKKKGRKEKEKEKEPPPPKTMLDAFVTLPDNAPADS